MTTNPVAAKAAIAESRRSWNDTATSYERDSRIEDVVAERVAEDRTAVALECEERLVTYGELDDATYALAAQLVPFVNARRALGSEPYVAVHAERSIEAIISFLAVLRAGAAYVPIDPTLPRERQRFILDDTAPCALLAQAKFAGRLGGAPEIVVDDSIPTIATERDRSLSRGDAGATDPAYVMYTSGASGRPKGVVVHHRGILRFVRGARDLRPQRLESVLCVGSLGFDLSTYEIWGALSNGSRLVIVPAGHFDGALVATTIDERGVRVAFVSPGSFHHLVDAELGRLGGLRQLIVGGDVMSPAHARRFVAAHRACRLVNAYGPTETTVSASVFEVGELESGQSVPIGRPLDNTTLYVLDEDRRPVGAGESGELYIGGDGVALGYLNLAELSARAFLPDPFADEPDARLYRSGDVVRLRSDGDLEFLGRADDQVKIRGYRVEPGEVEAVVSGCRGVAQSVVIAREDLPGHRRLVAYVVAEDGLDLRELRRYLASRLPDYQVPSAIVVLDGLPLTDIGKVDRNALPAPPLPSGRGWAASAPSSAAEVVVAAAWRAVLRVDAPSVDDDFFEAGGDSLLALAFVARIRDTIGVELPVAGVFGAKTLGAIAREIDTLQRSPRSAGLGFVPLEPGGAGAQPSASLGQAQLCFLTELADDALPYQSQAVIWLDGPLVLEALRRALDALVARHEILRTTLHPAHGDWSAQVHAPYSANLPLVDLAERRAREEELASVFAACARIRIDPRELPLVRWTLVRLHAQRHALIQVEHHAIHDGASFALLVGELSHLYHRFEAGEDDDRPPPRLQHRDFARWQREFTRSALGRSQLDYWTQRLAALPPPIDLATARSLRAPFTFRGAALRERLDPALNAAIRVLSNRLGATPFIVMASAFALLLHRLSGQGDVVFGSGLSNRRVAGSESVLGMLVNTVALRVAVEGTLTVEDLIERTREVCLGAYDAQELPFEEVVRVAAPDRDGGPSPIYRHLFSFHDSPFAELGSDTLSIIPRDALSNGSAKADLNVVVVDHRNHAAGEAAASWDGAVELAPAHEPPTIVWEYCTDLFEEERAQEMLGEYLAILASMVDDPTQQLARVRLLSSRRRAELISSAGSQQPYERDAMIAEVFAERVAEDENAIALAFPDGAVTYGELDRVSDRFAAVLAANGVRPEDFVGVVDDRSFSMYAALLGILKVGAAYVGLDTTLPEERLASLAAQTRMAVACSSPRSSSRHFVALLEQSGVRLVEIDWQDTRRAGGTGAAPSRERHRGRALDSAYVSFTSGSTGEPKGVVIHQRAVVRLARSANYVDLSTSQRVLAMAPLSFDASTFEIWGALLNGGCIVPAAPGPLSASEVASVVRDGAVTTAFLTSVIFHEMVDHELAMFATLQQVIAGGDVLSPAHVNLALRELPVGGILVNGYGPTEATTFSCCHVMAAGTQVDGPVPIGVAIPNTVVHVLDGEGEPVPSGVVGEIYVGGDGLATGYLGSPELTAASFPPDPFDVAGSARLYRTGDLARRRPDGVLEFVGRRDRQVKIRGFRVEPAEAEAALLRQPALRQAVVAPFEYAPDDKRLVAYLVAREAGEGRLLVARPSDEELTNSLSMILPRYLIPAAFVWLDELPQTNNGKLDEARLPPPTLCWVPTGLDEPERGVSRRWAHHSRLDVGAGATSSMQLRLIELFQEALGVKPVGLHDNFFELGGHSLLALSLFAAIERTTGARLPLATIFEAPTVAQLAAVLREGGWDAPWGSIVTLTATGERPPLFFVSPGDGNTIGYGALARRLGPSQPFYALQPRGLDGRAPLHRSVEAMAAHYVGLLRRVQRRGPYLLGGRCFGTLVAYEMTRRLEAAGEEVGVLFAIDSIGPLWTPRWLANEVSYDEVMNVARVQAGLARAAAEDIFIDRAAADEFVSWLREPVSESAGQVVSRYVHAAWLARRDLQEAYPLSAGAHAGLAHWSWVGGRSEMGMNPLLLPPVTDEVMRARQSRDPRRISIVARGRAMLLDLADVVTRGRLANMVERRQRRLVELAVQTTLRYRGGPCTAPIALLRSDEYADDALLARWYGLDTGGVEELPIRGSHLSIVREPDVARLARAIEGRVDAFVGRRTSPSAERS